MHTEEPDMELVFSAARITTTLIFLIFASWSDFKTREVSNNVWIIFAPIAFLLTFAEFLLFTPPIGTALQSMVYYGLSFTITTIFSIVLFYVGAFGGADAKALMCISLALPLPPESFQPLSGFVSPIFPITIFSNSVIVAALSVFYALFRNLFWKRRTGKNLFEDHEAESFGRKALALLCGYKVSVMKLKESFLYPLEDYETTQKGEANRRLLLFPKDEEREIIVERLEKARNEKKIPQMVWATPGLPMLIFITIGLILALTLGDIIWIIIGGILR